MKKIILIIANLITITTSAGAIYFSALMIKYVEMRVVSALIISISIATLSVGIMMFLENLYEWYNIQSYGRKSCISRVYS